MRYIFSLLCCLFSVGASAWTRDADLFESDQVVEELQQNYKPIYQDQKPALDGWFDSSDPTYPNLEIRYMRNRRALTGDSCCVNRLVHAVSVGAWDKDKGNLLDEDLDNCAQFNRVIGAGVTTDPVVSIRDMRCYYAKGTQAGFAVVAGSGNAVLTLDVVRAYAIDFYRNGTWVGSKAIEEGQGGEGIALKLIQIPGSDDAMVMFTATSDWVFDEVQLNRSGGVQAGVGDLLKVKYGFVGRARSFYIGTDTPAVGDGIQAYRDFTDRDGIEFPTLKGWNPVLLGLPFPFTKETAGKMSDGNPGTGAAITPILAVGYQGGAKFTIGDTGNASEIFPAGTEVGWVYKFGSGLNLDAGTWIRLILFDRNGNKVQEETVSAEVLGLSVGSGGDGTTSLTSSVPFSGCEIRFHTVLAVDLGAIVMKNAFVRMKPDVSHHCPINPTMSTNICDTQNSFQLRANEDLTVTWSLESWPKNWPSDVAMVAVTPGGYVTDMNLDGDYLFRATASDGCVDYVKITRGGFGEYKNNECTMPLMNKTTAGIIDRPLALSDDIYSSSGALLSISDLRNSENILEGGMDECAEYTGGLGVANNLMIVGVKTDYEWTEQNKTDNPDKYYFANFANPTHCENWPKGLTVGFIIEHDITGLDLSLLEFMQIRCFLDGEEVYRSVVKENNGLDVGLGGSADTRKIRYAITVPHTDKKGNYIAFNEFQLWKCGVLDLKLDNLKIYYAFMEDAAAGCNDPLGCGATILGTSTHTTLNTDECQTIGVLTVAKADDNLAHFVDDDDKTYMMIANTVNAGGTTIAVNLGRTLDYRHELGIILDQDTYAASIGVGSWLTLKTYYKGEPTGEEFNDWKALGADVAGAGDRKFLYIHPQARYDEVRLTIAGVANAFQYQKYYGLFIRGDIDNDGIPDCQDDASCVSTIEDIVVNSVCVGDIIKVSGKGTVETQFSVLFTEPDAKGNPHKFTANSDKDGKISFEYQTQKPGFYDMVFYDGSGHPILSQPYSVHPTRTTWRTNASDTDWNKWDNWSDGTPYCCTNVIIPSGAANYPLLEGYVRSLPDSYCAKGVHIEPGAKIDGITKLNYESAWVEASLMPNTYHNLSAPLQQMNTGDWFAPVKALPAYFTTLTADNTIENRFNPTVFQRLWDKTARGRLWGTGYEDIQYDETNWTREFNDLKYQYPLGSGYSLWVDNGKLPADQPVLFRMPKTHTQYWYYSDYDQKRIDDVFETFADSDRDKAGRFAYEAATLKGAYTAPAEWTYKEQTRYVYDPFVADITLTSEKSTNAFLFGNPFMSELKLEEFLALNGYDQDIHPSNHITAVGFYDGNTTATVSLEFGFPEDVLVNSSGRRPVVYPFESVWLYTNTALNELTITLDETMIGTASIAPPVTPGLGAPEMLRIVARNDKGLESGVVLVNKESTSTHEVMIDNEVRPRLMIGAVHDGTLCDIAPTANSMPLAIVTEGEQSITIATHKMGGFDWEQWQLRDAKTGVVYSLEDDIDLGMQQTTIGRYILEKKQTNKVEGTTANDLILTIDGDIVSVSSSDNITSISAYDMSGNLLVSQQPNAPTAQLQLPQGIILLRLSTNFKTTSYKLFIR